MASMPSVDIQIAGLIAIVAWILLIYLIITIRPSRVFHERRPRRFLRSGSPSRKYLAADFNDVGKQLHAAMAASFQKRRILSPSEYHVFKIIEYEILARRNGYRVFAQTNLGEILASGSEDAFHSINSKRVDILIVDQGGWPVLAVEYQGDAHYQGTAAARDAIKKEALRKAGVRYLEVSSSDSPEQIRSRVHEQLGWKSAADATLVRRMG
jgi:hypothetical protein